MVHLRLIVDKVWYMEQRSKLWYEYRITVQVGNPGLHRTNCFSLITHRFHRYNLSDNNATRRAVCELSMYFGQKCVYLKLHYFGLLISVLYAIAIDF